MTLHTVGIVICLVGSTAFTAAFWWWWETRDAEMDAWRASVAAHEQARAATAPRSVPG